MATLCCSLVASDFILQDLNPLNVYISANVMFCFGFGGGSETGWSPKGQRISPSVTHYFDIFFFVQKY